VLAIAGSNRGRALWCATPGHKNVCRFDVADALGVRSVEGGCHLDCDLDHAGVGVVQCGRGASFTTKAFQSLRILGKIVEKKLQSDEAAKLDVLSLVIAGKR